MNPLQTYSIVGIQRIVETDGICVWEHFWESATGIGAPDYINNLFWLTPSPVTVAFVRDGNGNSQRKRDGVWIPQEEADELKTSELVTHDIPPAYLVDIHRLVLEDMERGNRNNLRGDHSETLGPHEAGFTNGVETKPRRRRGRGFALDDNDDTAQGIPEIRPEINIKYRLDRTRI